MQEGAAEFWKDNKAREILPLASDKVPTWEVFLKMFREVFELLDVALNMQMKLRDLRMKERANEYCYKFNTLADQTSYNDAAQIEVFQRELPTSLIFKIMTRPEGKPMTIQDWMKAAIQCNESFK
ncbi:hypothetical protein Moror_11684 [Moniliophthora roreri MCA 2997]|uniref:Retrotransposon gag domain-containing protein n=1 Tax=Moniliophthora roreri (strain MCA 2997) TaxID=1381753 RepID=V2X3L0_MONRO|nr:hypothetical protein Moror_11684 [Moniliophthora roreri MCA 2997]